MSLSKKEGRHKLADVSEEEPHIVLRQPNPEIPVFDVQQVDGRGHVKTVHHHELLPFNSIPVEELQKEAKQSNMGNGSNTEPRVSNLLETENSAQSSSESSSEEDDNDDEEKTPAQWLPPQTQVRCKKLPRIPQRQRKPPGWLTTGNWVI